MVLIILHSPPTFVVSSILFINVLFKWLLLSIAFGLFQKSSLIRIKFLITWLYPEIEEDLRIIEVIGDRDAIDSPLFVGRHVSD